MTTRDELTTNIARLRNEITKAEQEVRDFEKLTPAQELATEIHKAFCRSARHVGGDFDSGDCRWFHDETWDAYNRNRYLKKAKRMLQITDLETGIEIIELMKSF